MPDNDETTTGTITTDDGDRAEFEAWRSSRANKPQDVPDDQERSEDAPETRTEASGPSDDIDARIEAALARERERHAQETANLRSQLPSGTTPLNAGGVVHGENEDTWSQYDQDLANRGEHPLQQKDDNED